MKDDVKCLIDLLQNGSQEEKEMAAFNLGDCMNEEAVPALLDALKNHKDDVVGMRAAWALGAIGGKNIISKLCHIMLEYDDEFICGNSALALAKLSSPKSIKALAVIVKRGNDMSSVLALVALRRIFIKMARTVKVLISSMDGESIPRQELQEKYTIFMGLASGTEAELSEKCPGKARELIHSYDQWLSD